MATVIDTLQERGLFEAVTSPDIGRLVENPAAVYAGFDPSASSLQIGNYVTIMGLAHFQRAGHKVVALVGGATGLIGDPSGKTNERPMLSAEEVEQNLEGIRENLSRFLDLNDKQAPAVIVNNHDWMKRFTFVEFLRDVGKHFRVGAMLAKESVRARMEGDRGMSYAEFSYQLIQAYDFLHLYDTEGCRIQIGGSDQWGNITAGTDLIRKLRGVEAYGLTFPILCDSTGRKFGKSEGNAVYLDRRRTSYYQFYQYFLRTADADVIRYLRVLTFVPMDEIAAMEEAMQSAPEERIAQKRLAEELTRAVHGTEGLTIARRASEVLFGGTLSGLRVDDLLEIFADVPSVEKRLDEVRGRPLVDVACAAGLCRSKGEVRRLMADGGFYVNNQRVTEHSATVNDDMLIEGRMVVLRSGRRHFLLVRIV